jgi:hypothetical protein
MILAMCHIPISWVTDTDDVNRKAKESNNDSILIDVCSQKIIVLPSSLHLLVLVPDDEENDTLHQTLTTTTTVALSK